MLCLRHIQSTLTAIVVAGVLSACGGVAVAPPADTHDGLPAQGATILSSPHAILPSLQRSWMAPNAGKQQLLYISDEGTGSVSVYSYPYFTLLGTLAGFAFPQGLCVDAAGDVFITDAFAQNIREYAHGSLMPKATLKDPGYKPDSCSIDPTTGNLAVSNFGPTSGSSNGNVAIYKGAAGSPIAYYSAPSLYQVFFCGYDGAGNLFVDGEAKGSTFDLAELLKGKKSFTHIFVNQPIQRAGGLQWDGKYLVVGDLTANAIYRFAIIGTHATDIGAVPLTGSKEVVQFWVQSPKIIGPDFASGDVGIWKYPSGGAALKVLTGFTGPFGATISTVKT